MPDTQLIITLRETGKVEVTGPIDNKLFCYGLLENAKDAIRDYNPAHAEPLITPAHSISPVKLRD